MGNDLTVLDRVLTRPGIRHIMTVPEWLGGARTVQWMFRHKWSLWLVVWPILKIKRIPK